MTICTKCNVCLSSNLVGTNTHQIQGLFALKSHIVEEGYDVTIVTNNAWNVKIIPESCEAEFAIVKTNSEPSWDWF